MIAMDVPANVDPEKINYVAGAIYWEEHGARQNVQLATVYYKTMEDEEFKKLADFIDMKYE